MIVIRKNFKVKKALLNLKFDQAILFKILANYADKSGYIDEYQLSFSELLTQISGRLTDLDNVKEDYINYLLHLLEKNNSIVSYEKNTRNLSLRLVTEKFLTYKEKQNQNLECQIHCV